MPAPNAAQLARRVGQLMDEQPCDIFSGGKCDSHPSPFDAANGFLSVAFAIFLPTAFDACHRLFSRRRSARHRAASLTAKRRGKCHG